MNEANLGNGHLVTYGQYGMYELADRELLWDIGGGGTNYVCPTNLACADPNLGCGNSNVVCP